MARANRAGALEASAAQVAEGDGDPSHGVENLKAPDRIVQGNSTGVAHSSPSKQAVPRTLHSASGANVLTNLLVNNGRATYTEGVPASTPKRTAGATTEAATNETASSQASAVAAPNDGAIAGGPRPRARAPSQKLVDNASYQPERKKGASTRAQVVHSTPSLQAAAAAKPAAAQPAAMKPAMTKPAVTRPAATEPAATQDAFPDASPVPRSARSRSRNKRSDARPMADGDPLCAMCDEELVIENHSVDYCLGCLGAIHRSLTRNEGLDMAWVRSQINQGLKNSYIGTDEHLRDRRKGSVDSTPEAVLTIEHARTSPAAAQPTAHEPDTNQDESLNLPTGAQDEANKATSSVQSDSTKFRDAGNYELLEEATAALASLRDWTAAS